MSLQKEPAYIYTWGVATDKNHIETVDVPDKSRKIDTRLIFKEECSSWQLMLRQSNFSLSCNKQPIKGGGENSSKNRMGSRPISESTVWLTKYRPSQAHVSSRNALTRVLKLIQKGSLRG